MTAERQQFRLALGLSAGVNVLLFFCIAWSMAVTRGLTGKSRKLLAVPALTAEEPPEMISLVLSPEPEPAATPQRQMITSPDDQPDTAPTDPATPFISSANMKAASEEAATPDGMAGLATQQGIDKPFLDLRDREFRDGEETTNRPPETAPAPPLPAAASPPPPAPGETPPEPDEAPTDREKTPPDPSGETRDKPPEKEPPPARREEVAEAAPALPAFRDDSSQTLIPAPAPAAPVAPPTPAFRQASRPPPAPMSRIPDRIPEYSPGTRKAKTLGTISNKGQASLDATATAEGKFGKIIRTAIEKGWRRRMLSLSSLANPGLVEVEFEVDAKGRISNVKLANPGEANPVMQDCALSAVIEAKLPPPPPELLEELRDNLTGNRMRCSFSFLIY